MNMGGAISSDVCEVEGLVSALFNGFFLFVLFVWFFLRVKSLINGIHY